MKTVFMGTPEGAAYLLGELAASGHEICSAVTRPDKPKGRGLKVQISPVAKRSEELDIPVLKPADVSDPAFLDEIRRLVPDVVIIAAFGRILPKALLDIPKHGCINVHLSLLPKYRGASPVQAALMSGDEDTGITIMRINERLDEGDILAQEKVKISVNENAGELTERLFVLGGKLLLSTLPAIGSGEIASVKQDGSKATFCKPIKRSDGLISISDKSRNMINKIRAFTPRPGAYLECKGKKLKITSAEVYTEECSKMPPGTAVKLIKGRGLVVAAGDGCVLIKEVQPENSKIMSAEGFVNGYRIAIGEKIF